MGRSSQGGLADRALVFRKWPLLPVVEKNVQEMYLKFYSWKSMFQRLPLPVTQADIASWIVNLSQRKLAQRSLGNHNNNFDAY